MALRRRVFTHSSQSSDSALAGYYRTLLFENPWRTDEFPSFVHEEPSGEIRGFVGAIPRPMLLGQQPLKAVVSTELMVAPESRGLVGAALFRRLFAGAQDLTISDRSNHQARALYEGLGGTTAVWNSLYWTVSLDGSRPRFDRRPGATRGLASRALQRIGSSFDRLAHRLAGRSSEQLPTHDEPLAPETVVSGLRRVVGPSALVPTYELHTFAWLLDRVRESIGRVVSAQVMQGGELAGWFVYAVRANGEAEVVQLAAPPGRQEMVFDDLIQHGMREGIRVLRGRADRHFATVLSDRGVPLTLGHPWTVVQSRRADLMTQFAAGNVFFSRLDAEWWIGT